MNLLVLSKNNIQDIKKFFQLDSSNSNTASLIIKKLDLSSNSISELDGDLMNKHFSKLESLNLKSNAFTSLNSTNWLNINFKYLKSLDLSNNDI